VHIAYEDACGYAEWAGKELPSEAEWERAARGGLPASAYAWGDKLTPGGQILANIWIGEFPWRRHGDYERTSPVGSFPPNGYGLHDMIGNVWEWTTDRFAVPAARGACCAGGNAREEGDDRPVKVVKGGSYLCAPNYCRRYRPAARQPQTVDTSASHIGFRCVQRKRRATR
jgi:formylglycine-generating enzyme required for sulfatase activity